MPSFILALAFFPIFDSSPGELLGLSLVNTSTRSAEINIFAFRADGSIYRTGGITLPAGGQHTSLIGEILGASQSPPMGWIRIDSNEPGLASYLTSGSDSALDAAEPAWEVSKTIFLPHISINTGFTELAHTDTLVMLVNPNHDFANARAELIGLDGGVAGQAKLTVPGLGALQVRISETFNELLPSNGQGGKTFEGYLRVSSSGSLVAWQRIDTPLSQRILRGYATEELLSTRLTVAPHFAFGGSKAYLPVLNIVNPTNWPVTLELNARNDSGRPIGETIRRTLGPGQCLRGNVISLFRVVIPAVFPPPLITGHIQIGNPEGAPFLIIGDIEITAENNSAAMAFLLQPEAARNWVVPFALNSTDYFTGYAIANPNETAAGVIIEVLKSDGSLAGTPRKVSLPPFSRTTALVEDKIPAGYLRVTADSPVTVAGSIGRRYLSALAPVPPLRIAPEERRYLFSFEDGMEEWEARGIDLELGGGEIDWSVTRTRERAFHGSTAVRLYLANNNDMGKIWIERQLLMNPNRAYRVALRFAFGSRDISDVNAFGIIAGVLPKRPENRNELIYQEWTGNPLGSPWLEKSYGFTVRSSPEGAIYVTVGVWGAHETVRSYLVDAIEVSVGEQ